jgi:hypothetical protein
MREEELLDAIKLLITTLDSTTWDEGNPSYSGSKPGYNCPDCSCEDCYRVSCDFNKSELFKKLHKELPKLYES